MGSAAELGRSIEPEVRIHAASLAPYSSFVDNNTLKNWIVDKAGADAIEWIAAGPIIGSRLLPIGPTHDILAHSPEDLKEAVDNIDSGHVIFHPLATAKDIFLRRDDPLKPGGSIPPYHIIFSTQDRSEKALQKIEAIKKGKFPVVVYPDFNGKKLREDNFTTRLLQTHPSEYNDARGVDGFIEAFKKGEVEGVCVDTYHIQEAIVTKVRPFGTTEDELKENLEKLHNAGALEEVHVQAGRMINVDESIEDENHKELAAMLGENPSYDTRLGRTLKFLKHELGFMGPYVWEGDPRALIKTHGWKVMLPPSRGPILDIYGAIVDYIRRA